MPSTKVKAKVHFACPIQTSHVPRTLVFWPVPFPPGWRCCFRDVISLEMGTDRRDSLTPGLKSAVLRSSAWAHVERKSWCDLSPRPKWEKGAKRKGLERSKRRLEPPLHLCLPMLVLQPIHQVQPGSQVPPPEVASVHGYALLSSSLLSSASFFSICETSLNSVQIRLQATFSSRYLST